MRSSDQYEIMKWLRLAEETFGAAGVSAMAEAMGLAGAGVPARKAGIDRRAPATESGTAVPACGSEKASGDWLGDDSGSGQQRWGTPLACPAMPPRAGSSWRPYAGDPTWFHCGYEGYQENRAPAPDWPAGVCFYDEGGRLVDEAHPYAGCRGTPNSYDAEDPRHWLWHDPGGIWNSGYGGAGESHRHANDRVRQIMNQQGYPPFSIGPFRAPLPGRGQ